MTNCILTRRQTNTIGDKNEMSSQSSTIVQRLWNYCNVLRDDGVSYGDYVEQLTYLLFLKMADEQVRELAACRRGTHKGPSANETRRVFADQPTPKRVKML